MKDLYIQPDVGVISFVPNKAIALHPSWGYEGDVFSTPEPKMGFGDDTEGGAGDEG